MDSLWRDAAADGWELSPGTDFLAKHVAGAPLRQAEPGDLALGHRVMLLVLVGLRDGGEPWRDRVLVEVVRLGQGRVDRPHVGRVVDGLRQSYCPSLMVGEEVAFLPEHIAAIRVFDSDGGGNAC